MGRLIALLVAVLLTTSSLASAEYKIAFVDLEQALERSQAGQKAKKEFEVEVEKAQGDLEKKKGEYHKLQTAYKNQRESLNETARADKEERLISMEKDLKRSFKDTQDLLRRANARILGNLMEEVRKAVNQVGEQNNYTLILERNGQSVLFADKSIDITDAVVKQFDKMTK